MQSYCPKGHKNVYSFDAPANCGTCKASMKGEIKAKIARPTYTQAVEPDEELEEPTVQFHRPKKLNLKVEADLIEKLVLDESFIKSGNGEIDGGRPPARHFSAQAAIDKLERNSK